jgi:hypothetical protein
MIALLLGFAAVAPGTYDFRSVAEFQETSSVGGLDVALPVIACARKRIEAHQVAPDEAGSAEKANDYAIEQLDACGLNAAQGRLTATLATRLQVTKQDAERRASAYFSFIRDVMVRKADQQFKVAPTTSEMTVAVPACPPMGQQQPKSCPDR